MFESVGQIRAVFIGQDGSMGLKNGRAYTISIYTQIGYIFVKWGKRDDQLCPYGSIDKLNKNWRSI